MTFKTEAFIKAEIESLKAKLTGDLFEDMGTQQEIYELKKKLNPAIEDDPSLDDDEDCLYCGS